MAVTARRCGALLALVAAALLALAGGARAGGLPLPVAVEAGAVTVRAEAGMERLAGAVARRAPAVLERIAADLPGLPVPPRVEIRLVVRAADLGRAAPAGLGAPPWASGVAYPAHGVVVVATRREAHSIDVHSVVAHELAHLALGAALGGRAPRWLDEGFAYLHSSEFSMGRVQTLTGMAWSGNVIPLAELDRRFPDVESEVDRAYAQSYDFVAFLARRGRYPDPHDDGDRWAFRDFLRAIADGASVHQAARAIYNASLEDLFDEWYQDLRQRYLLVPAGLVGLGVWVLASILLVLAYWRRRRVNRRTLARWEEEERATAPRAPDDLS
jgi:hypothetical protein